METQIHKVLGILVFQSQILRQHVNDLKGVPSSWHVVLGVSWGKLAFINTVWGACWHCFMCIGWGLSLWRSQMMEEWRIWLLSKTLMVTGLRYWMPRTLAIQLHEQKYLLSCVYCQVRIIACQVFQIKCKWSKPLIQLAVNLQASKSRHVHMDLYTSNGLPGSEVCYGSLEPNDSSWLFNNEEEEWMLHNKLWYDTSLWEHSSCDSCCCCPLSK